MTADNNENILTPEIVESSKRAVLCWLATVDDAGVPNVSPKEIFATVEGHVVVANIASPGTVRNLAANRAVCLSFVDIFVQKGFKLKGVARTIRPDEPTFGRWVAPLEAMTGGRFPIHAVILVQVTSAEPLLAPSYRLYPNETTEAGQVEAAMRTYGVQPRT